MKRLLFCVLTALAVLVPVLVEAPAAHGDTVTGSVELTDVGSCPAGASCIQSDLTPIPPMLPGLIFRCWYWLQPGSFIEDALGNSWGGGIIYNGTYIQNNDVISCNDAGAQYTPYIEITRTLQYKGGDGNWHDASGLGNYITYEDSSVHVREWRLPMQSITCYPKPYGLPLNWFRFEIKVTATNVNGEPISVSVTFPSATALLHCYAVKTN